MTIFYNLFGVVLHTFHSSGGRWRRGEIIAKWSRGMVVSNVYWGSAPNPVSVVRVSSPHLAYAPLRLMNSKRWLPNWKGDNVPRRFSTFWQKVTNDNEKKADLSDLFSFSLKLNTYTKHAFSFSFSIIFIFILIIFN